jgi:6-phosphogluconate dehydrogenase (decarboxylating)
VYRARDTRLNREVAIKVSARNALASENKHGGDCWLLDLTAISLLDQPTLEKFSGHVSDSGEGRWTINAAIDEGAPVPVLSAALFQRFDSRGESDFANKLLSAMRFQFGGHIERTSGG